MIPILVSVLCLFLGINADPTSQDILITQINNEAFKNLFQTVVDLTSLYETAKVEVELFKSEPTEPPINVWAVCGTLNPACNINLKDYAECSRQTSDILEDKILFVCNQRSRYIIVFSSRPIGDVSSKLGVPADTRDASKYRQVQTALDMRQKDIMTVAKNWTSLPELRYTGSLLLIGWNATAASITADNEVVIALSRVEAGRVAMVANNVYLDTRRYPELLGNLGNWVVSSKKWISPKAFIDVSQLKDQFPEVPPKVPIIWDAHMPIGKNNVVKLLALVRKGAGLIIGLKTWAYHDNIARFEESELYPLLLASGIWPSKNVVFQTWSVKPREMFAVGDQKAREHLSMELKAKYMIASMIEFRSLKSATMDIFQQLPPRVFHEWISLRNVGRDFFAALTKYRSWIETLVPCQAAPLFESDFIELLLGYNKVMNTQVLANFGFKAPGVFLYPGDVTSTHRLAPILTVVCSAAKEAIPTGFYVPPGETVVLTPLVGDPNNWHAVVNFNLFDVSERPPFHKWPIPSVTVDIQSSRNTVIFSALGGLLWIQCDRPGIITLQFSNVVEAPRWDLRDQNTIDTWEEQREYPGPWATLAGDSVLFVVPSTSIRDLVDPRSIILLYDKAFKHQLHLAGGKVRSRRREIVSMDVQILTGYMHSGYPIGANLVVAVPHKPLSYLFNVDHLESNGNWGLFHEHGHNLQDNSYVFRGTREVSCNVFTILAKEALTGQPFFSSSSTWFSRYSVLSYFYFGADIRNWKKNHMVALVIYAQLAHHFGWEFYRKVFRRYKDMPMDEKMALNTDSKKLERWVYEVSHVAGYNLVPLFNFWGFDLDATFNGKLKGLVEFLPDDFIMDFQLPRVHLFTQRYPNATRHARKVPIDIGPLKNWSRVEGVITIFRLL